MLGKFLLAGAIVGLFGALTIATYEDASAQGRGDRGGGFGRGGGARTGGGQIRGPGRVQRPGGEGRRPGRVDRPTHRRVGSPGGHRRGLSPGEHSRRLSPGGHPRRLSGHPRRLSLGHGRGLSGHPRRLSLGHERFGSPSHGRRTSRPVHRRAWSWHLRRGSGWGPVAPVVPAVTPAPGVASPAVGACECTCLMTIYKGENLTGENREARVGEPDLGPGWDKQIGSIYVSRGNWEVFQDMNYQGEVRRLAPGPYGNLGQQWTGAISSLRCVR